MRDMKALEKKLQEIFQTEKVEYYRMSHQTNNYIFFVSCKKIDAEIQSNWSENFPEGSYYGIAKAVKQDHINLTVDITPEDAKKLEVAYIS